MYIAMFPSSTAGCYLATGGDANQFGFKTVEAAKKAAEAFAKTSTVYQAMPIVILDLDTLEVVSSVHRVPNPLPWVDRKSFR